MHVHDLLNVNGEATLGLLRFSSEIRPLTPTTSRPETHLSSTRLDPILGGSWVVIRGVISRATIVISHIRGLLTLRITSK